VPDGMAEFWRRGGISGHSEPFSRLSARRVAPSLVAELFAGVYRGEYRRPNILSV